ncbi:PASTA domain-containing protein [uncultured Dokdonia sp.]|uniref:PASTA domain-containing protein n=1 Tax=uncultured Dokdonia sp. TaxID=575653 RepID=UPI002616F70E|nr:PASTA domain-containing protein [uncultured Dokdonia sp.]
MKLFFKVTLRDHHGKIPEEMKLDIQFFNTDTKAWEKIDSENAGYLEGTYNFEYYIPSRIYGDQPTLRKVREVLQTGGMPMFRLIDALSKEQVYILAKQGAYTMLEDAISYDFGNLSLLQREQIEDLDNPKIPSVLIATAKIAQDTTPEMEDLQKEIDDLKEQIRQQEANNETNTTSGEQVEEIDFLTRRVSSLEEDINNLASEKGVLETTITQQNQTISSQLGEINHYKNIEQQQQNTISTLEAEKQTLQQQIDESSQETVEEEYIPKSVSANKLYTDVIDEIKIAKENTVASGFKLSNISINLKTVAEKDEGGLRFQVIDINNASAINGAAISDIKIDITEDETPVVNELIVPKLIGLTETAARNYLEKFSLRLDPVYQLIDTQNSTLSQGQAFKQSPEPGTTTTPDATITVIFAKNNQHLN